MTGMPAFGVTHDSHLSDEQTTLTEAQASHHEHTVSIASEAIDNDKH
jgi:hypothetical protein